MMKAPALVLALLLSPAVAWAAPEPLPVPGGAGGIGFDDLLWAPSLGRVLVPSGRTGNLNLLDPKSREITSISGFSTGPAKGEGHGAGTTSADAVTGLLFASDRDRQEVVVVDGAARKIVSHAKLAGRPDYVRWVEKTGEVWVTEPSAKQIEFFHLNAKESRLEATGTLSIPDGPESLVVDPQRGRAYTHTWHETTQAVDLASHKVVARWKNGCGGARGIALDAARGQLFVGCDEGKATSLDVAHDGKLLGEVAAGKGVDIIAYSPALHHLYVPGGDDATLTVVGVDASGKLTVLGHVPTAEDAHCVAADDEGHVFVCDPKRGGLLAIHDEYPAWK